MILREFVAEDYIHIAQRAVEGDLKCFMSIEDWANLLFANSRAYTVCEDQQRIVCGGVRRLWPGTGVAWLEANLEVHRLKRARALELYGRYGFEKITHEEPFRCIMAEARPEYGNPKILRWLKFARVGRLPRYLPNGKDVILYVWNG